MCYMDSTTLADLTHWGLVHFTNQTVVKYAQKTMASQFC